MDIAEVKQENDRELIAKVQQHPVLYNLSAPKYKDTKAKPAIWDEIAESIDGIGDGKAAQARWQSLRDQFRKKLKPASGSAAEDATPYIYAEEMDFLRPFFQERPSSSTSRTRTLTGKPAPNHDEIQDIEAAMIDVENDSNSTLAATSPPAMKTPSRKRKIAEEEVKLMDPVDGELLQILKENRSENEPEDDHLSYSRTVANFMRKLSSRKAREFRMEVEGLMLKYEPEEN